MAQKTQTQKTNGTPTATLVTPPTRSVQRSSSADEQVLKDMAQQIEEGWTSNGIEYETQREAANACVVYRRGLIKLLGGDPAAKGDPIGKTIRSKVWGQGETDPETKKAGGPFVFALGKRS